MFQQLSTLFIVLLSISGALSAFVASPENGAHADAEAFWTAEALLSAKPVPVTFNSNASVITAAVGGRVQYANGKGPSAPSASVSKSLHSTADAHQFKSEETTARQESPNDFSTTSNPFTSSRVFPDVAVRTYPYAPAVKIFFSDASGNRFVCSGALIKRGIVSTAGHCVHPGNNNPNSFYRNYLIVPAYDRGSAPYGSWTNTRLYVTSTWFSGGGGVPNAADYAFIVLNLDSAGRSAGHYAGYLGYQTLALSGNHVTVLGYPCNFDSCLRLHQVTGQVGTTSFTNTRIMGSDMRGGSSGGPWVQNFQVISAGQTPQSGTLRIVGVVSYGPVSTSLTYQGASVPDSRFVSALNAACTAYPSRCGA